jgi:hypothetical protein
MAGTLSLWADSLEIHVEDPDGTLHLVLTPWLARRLAEVLPNLAQRAVDLHAATNDNVADAAFLAATLAPRDWAMFALAFGPLKLEAEADVDYFNKALFT